MLTKISYFLDILRQRFRTLATYIPNNLINWRGNDYFVIGIDEMKTFASIIQYTNLIVFNLFVNEFTSLLLHN